MESRFLELVYREFYIALRKLIELSQGYIMKFMVLRYNAISGLKNTTWLEIVLDG